MSLWKVASYFLGLIVVVVGLATLEPPTPFAQSPPICFLAQMKKKIHCDSPRILNFELVHKSLVH